MSYSEPVIVLTGDLYPAAQHNTDVVLNISDMNARLLGQKTLLFASSGTDSNNSATTVASYALASTLTAKDSLIVFADVEAVTQQTSQPISLRNVTDGLNIANLSVDLAPGEFGIMAFRLRQSQAGNTKVNTLSQVDGSHSQYAGTQTNFTTPWTGAWTVGLRHNGVTSGGTLRWSMAVHVLRGQ